MTSSTATMTAKEAATALSVNDKTVRRWLKGDVLRGARRDGANARSIEPGGRIGTAMVARSDCGRSSNWSPTCWYDSTHSPTIWRRFETPDAYTRLHPDSRARRFAPPPITRATASYSGSTRPTWTNPNAPSSRAN